MFIEQNFLKGLTIIFPLKINTAERNLRWFFTIKALPAKSCKSPPFQNVVCAHLLAGTTTKVRKVRIPAVRFFFAFSINHQPSILTIIGDGLRCPTRRSTHRPTHLPTCCQGIDTLAGGTSVYLSRSHPKDLWPIGYVLIAGCLQGVTPTTFQYPGSGRELFDQTGNRSQYLSHDKRALYHWASSLPRVI